MSSSVSNEEAVITLKVKLIAETEGLDDDVSTTSDQDTFLEGGVSSEVQSTIDQEVKSSIDDLIGESLEKAGINLDAVQEMADLVDNVGATGMKTVTNFAKNPTGFTESTFMSILSKAGPYGALVGAIIAAIIASPILFKAIVEQLGVKGGPLNQDWRMSQEEQENQLYDRRTQFRRLTGDDPIITVNSLGFVKPSDPDFGGNSLVSANISRTGRIGLQDSSFGYVHGV